MCSGNRYRCTTNHIILIIISLAVGTKVCSCYECSIRQDMRKQTQLTFPLTQINIPLSIGVNRYRYQMTFKDPSSIDLACQQLGSLSLRYVESLGVSTLYNMHSRL